jgi:hypothetical protein
MSCLAVIGDRPIYSYKQRESIRRYACRDSRLGCPANAKRERNLAALSTKIFVDTTNVFVVLSRS